MKILFSAISIFYLLSSPLGAMQEEEERHTPPKQCVFRLRDQFNQERAFPHLQTLLRLPGGVLRVVLSYAPLTPSLGYGLQRVFELPSELDGLDLSESNLDGHFAVSLWEGVMKGRQIGSCWFAAPELARPLVPSFKRLDLSGNVFGDVTGGKPRSGIDFLRALCSSVEEIDLSRNKFSCIPSMLAPSPLSRGLRYANFSHNLIDDSGLGWIASDIYECPQVTASLEELYLHNNRYGKEALLNFLKLGTGRFKKLVSLSVDWPKPKTNRQMRRKFLVNILMTLPDTLRVFVARGITERERQVLGEVFRTSRSIVFLDKFSPDGGRWPSLRPLIK